MYDNEIPTTFDDISIVDSLEEPLDEEGLDFIEQQRSLERACRPELDPIFIGIQPPKKTWQ